MPTTVTVSPRPLAPTTAPTTTDTAAPTTVARPQAQVTGNAWSDPDTFFASAIDAQRSYALMRGIQGLVFHQAAHLGAAAVLDAQWKALQLNPLTARFYDGQVPAQAPIQDP